MTTGEDVSNLEHLAEMDRLLREIQVELSPEREPAPALEGAQPEPEATRPPSEPAPPPPEAAPPEAAPPPPEPTPPPPEAAPPPPEPAPPPPEPAPPPPEPAPPLSLHRDAPHSGSSRPQGDYQLQALSQLATRLLAAMRELLDGYEQFLVEIPREPTPAPPSRPTPTASPPPTRRRDDPGVTVAAGPFPSLEALHEFEQAVARLAGVRDVAVRGYEGADRAVIEVRLDRHGG